MLVQSTNLTSRLYGGGQSIAAAGQDTQTRQSSPGSTSLPATLPSQTAAYQLGGITLSSLIEVQTTSPTGVNSGRSVEHLIGGYAPPSAATGGVSTLKLPLGVA